MSKMLKVLGEISAERTRQDAKWGEQNHDDATWHLILAEEFGEISGDICKMVFDAKNGDDIDKLQENLDKELIQAAAVIVAWVEARKRRKK